MGWAGYGREGVGTVLARGVCSKTIIFVSYALSETHQIAVERNPVDGRLEAVGSGF